MQSQDHTCVSRGASDTQPLSGHSLCLASVGSENEVPRQQDAPIVLIDIFDWEVMSPTLHSGHLAGFLETQSHLQGELLLEGCSQHLLWQRTRRCLPAGLSPPPPPPAAQAPDRRAPWLSSLSRQLLLVASPPHLAPGRMFQQTF